MLALDAALGWASVLTCICMSWPVDALHVSSKFPSVVTSATSDDRLAREQAEIVRQREDGGPFGDAVAKVFGGLWDGGQTHKVKKSVGSSPKPLPYPKECIADGKVQLWWRTGRNGPKPYHDFTQECDVPCVELPSNQSCTRADGIIYHLPEHEGWPDVLHSKNQVNIGYSVEAAFNNHWEEPAKLMAEGFVVATPNPQSTVKINYFTLNEWKTLISTGVPKLLDRSSRKAAVAFIASNCEPFRMQLVSRLASRLHKLGHEIHSLGGCVPEGTIQVNLPEHKGERPDDAKHKALKKYRMYLALENAIETGYVTEKVFDGYRTGCVSIYHGAPDIAAYVPAGSFINIKPSSVGRFPDSLKPSESELKRVAKQIHNVMVDKSAWNEMMAWREIPVGSWDNGQFAKRWGGGWSDHENCRMCRAVCALASHPACTGKTFDRTTQSLRDR